MKKLFVLCLLLSGCAGYNGYYYTIHKNPIQSVSNAEKQKATFSVSSAINDEKFRKEIRNTFQKAGVFNSFSYTFFDEKSDYHFHFDVKRTGTSEGDRAVLGLMSGYFLMTIPISVSHNDDITMFLYVDKKEVYSITAPSHSRVFLWLPLILFSPTTWFQESNIRKNAINYFIHEVLDKKLYMRTTFPQRKTDEKIKKIKSKTF